MPYILLVQPPVWDFYLTQKRTIPYGLMCIGAALKKEGFSVEIFDSLATSKSKKIPLPEEMDYLLPYYGKPDISPFGLFHDFRHFGYSFKHIAKILREKQPAIVGISSLFTPYSDQALKVAKIAKKSLPGSIVVMGGHHPTFFYKEVMETGLVDFIIRGEGEVSFPILAKIIKTGGNPGKVPGIVFKKPDGSVYADDPVIMENPDDYPLPCLDFINRKYYMRKKHGSMVITTSRGCPMKCSYCCVGGSYLKYRRRSLKSVISEIEEGVVKYNVRFIDFEDENLSLNRSWFLRLLDAIISKFGTYNLELRAMNGLFAPSLDPNLILKMKQAGFKTLNLSLGTISENQLRIFNRPNVKDAIQKAVNLTKSRGLEAVCYIITGAPYQKPAESLDDILYLASRDVVSGISVYYPAPGSRLYCDCQKQGLMPEKFSLMRSTAIPISHKTSLKETITLLRLGRIVNFMKFLEKKGEKIPGPLPFCHIKKMNMPLNNRVEIGKRLAGAFLHDGRIRGITPLGEIYEHKISNRLVKLFLKKWHMNQPYSL